MVDNFMKFKTLILITFLFASGVVAAQGVKEKGGYIGGAFGVTEFDDDGLFDPSGIVVDDKDSSFQLYGGYKFLKYFAVEGRLIDLGSYTFSDQFFPAVRVTVDATAFTVNAVGILPLGSTLWELFGQLGLGQINLDISGFGDDDETIGSAGIGVRVTPTEHFSVALQVDAYAWEDDSFNQTFDMSIATTQVAFQYNF
jgi:OOP family OmpA-OmpF porin